MKNKEYANEELGVKFGLPTQFTVREILNLRGRVFDNIEDGWYIRYWEAIVPMLRDWECEAIPDPTNYDMDKSTNIKDANIVHWVTNTVAAHVAELDEIPKKS